MDWQLQLSKAIEKLHELKYRTKSIQVKTQDGCTSSGLVFASTRGLQSLSQHGHLMLMDSTHNTNSLKWLLYTLLVREETGCWLPAGHVLTSGQDSAILAEALTLFWEWTENCWQLRYCLTDDSAAEQAAIQQTFPKKEGEVQHLLCVVHSMRTIDQHLKSAICKSSRSHMITAMFTRKSLAGCEESVRATIAAAPDQVTRDYLSKNWLPTHMRWALYFQCHSCLLMQVQMTNAVEAWHSALKSNVTHRQKLTSFSLAGCTSTVAGLANQYEACAEKAEVDFRRCHLPELEDLPCALELPYPIQQLIATERRIARECIFESQQLPVLPDAAIGFEDWQCNCQFWVSYQLPCSHLLQIDLLFHVITDSMWDMYKHLFKDGSLEIYEKAGQDYTKEVVFTEVGAPAKRRLEMWERVDQLQATFYHLEEELTKAGPDVAEEVMTKWLDKLAIVTGSLADETIGGLLQAIGNPRRSN